MKHLHELLSFFQKNKPKHEELWVSILRPGSKMHRLFEAIDSGEVHTEEEAMMLLYGNTKEVARFNALKTKLKERLIKAILLLEMTDTSISDRQRAFLECNQKWAIIQILMTRNARLNGLHLLEKLLKNALHFEFTELAINALRMLRLHYGTIEGDMKRLAQINQQIAELEILWNRENQTEALYTQLTAAFVNSKASKTQVAEMARRCFEQIAPWLAESNAFKLQLLGRLIEMTAYTAINDYVRTAQLCEQAITFFQQKPYNSGLPLQVFYYQLVVCYVQLRDYEKGQALMDTHGHIFEEGSFNWFKMQELLFLLAMHTAHYIKAQRICRQILKHPKMSIQPANIQEMWKIYEAFSYLTERMGLMIPEAKPGAKFRLSKFLNEIPTYSRDKRGMNIPVLIIQILYLLLEQEYDKVIDRIEAIEKYCNRYLKQSETFRSNVFIKMLIQIPQALFHKEAVIRKTEKLLALLKSKPLEIANQSHEIEIIPYEDLWNMVLDNLERKFHHTAQGRLS